MIFLLRFLPAWKSVATFAKANWREALILALAFGWWWSHGNAVKNARELERVVAEVKAAEKTATTAQIVVNQEPARVAAIIVEQSNAQASAYYARVRAASTARIRPERVCPTGPGPTKPPYMPPTDTAVEGVYGPAGPSVVVSIARSDYDKFTAAAGRLAKVRQEVEAGVAAGIFIVE